MANVNLTQIADKYFSTINPIASKIKLDIIEITNAYEHLWKEFSPSEQSDVINETLIKPEIVLKYFDNFFRSKKHRKFNEDEDANDNEDRSAILPVIDCSYDGKHISTFSHCKTGLKINQDDICGVYRDEHSSPFCVKTKSQINFNAFDLDANICTGSTNNNQTPAKLKMTADQLKESTKNSNQFYDISAASQLTTTAFDKDALPLLVFNTDPNPILPTNCTTKSGGNFLSKLIIPFGGGGTTNGMPTSSQMKKKHLDDDQEQLVSQISLSSNLEAGGGGEQECSSIPSEEDDNKSNFGEFSSLLEHHELKKGYDFLNNW